MRQQEGRGWCLRRQRGLSGRFFSIYSSVINQGCDTVCRLSDYRLQLYVTWQYLNRHPTISTLSDLLVHRFIGDADEPAFSAALHYLHKCAPGAVVPLHRTSVIAQFSAVRQGHRLAILPCFIGNTCPELVPVLPGTAEVVRTFWLIAPSERRAGTHAVGFSA